jgi:hypothetical protein
MCIFAYLFNVLRAFNQAFASVGVATEFVSTEDVRVSIGHLNRICMKWIDWSEGSYTA